MCGCKSSTENNEKELVNKDINVRHRFLFGVHVSKDPEGIEGNVQIACGTIRKEKYEKVPSVTNTGERPAQQVENNPQATVEQLEDNSHDNG